MKTLLAVLITFSFVLSAQASQGDQALKEKITWALNQADKMGPSMTKSKINTVIFALEALAGSDIEDRGLIERVLNRTASLESNFSRGQDSLYRKSLEKLKQR